MRNIKDSYEDAVGLVEDFLSDKDLLEEEIWTRLAEGLEFWGQFEEALNEASDTPDIENQLTAMSKEIAQSALSRVESKYQIIEVAKVKALEDRIKQLESPLAGKEFTVVSTFNESRESDA